MEKAEVSAKELARAEAVEPLRALVEVVFVPNADTRNNIRKVPPVISTNVQNVKH